MIRAVVVALLCALAPMAPACAVVAIDTPARVVLVAGPADQLPSRPAPAGPVQQSSGPTIGELAAALIGLGVLGLTVFGSRQPHSVTA